jgi:hypothetical protein
LACFAAYGYYGGQAWLFKDRGLKKEGAGYAKVNYALYISLPAGISPNNAIISTIDVKFCMFNAALLAFIERDYHYVMPATLFINLLIYIYHDFS